MKKIFASLAILVMGLFLSPITSEAATQLNFYDVATLSSQEQEEIIKEKPRVDTAYAEYNLIYQKNDALSQADSNVTTGINNQAAVKKTTNSANLPEAGEDGQVRLLLFGSSLILISAFIFYKRKKYANILLIALLPTALGTFRTTALAVGDPLLPSETISLPDGEERIIEPTVISGYSYIGYYPTNKIPPITAESKVHVLYVDEHNNELHPAQTITGIVGDSYDASTEQYQLSIPGYTLNESTFPANALGIFGEQEQSVVYEYLKNTDNQGQVTVQYLDQNGAEIQSADLFAGEIGQSFQIETKDIPGFLFDHTSDTLSGIFTTNETIIKLYYTDEVSINIHYVAKETQQPLTLTSISAYADYLRPDISDIDSYYYTSSYNGKTYSQDETVTSDQLTVKVGTTYTLPKEIRFLITKPDGETLNTLNFPKPIIDLGWITAVDSYSNFLYFQEKPEYIPVNYTGTADQLSIDVTYEVTYIPTIIPEP